MQKQLSQEPSARLLKSIHVGRGFAALLVVAFHLAEALGSPTYFGERIYSYFLTAGGAAGVDFFFVLSGFIITSVHWGDVGRPERLPAYLFKRAVRIYPIYWAIFIAVYGSAFLAPGIRDKLPTDSGVLLASLLLLPQDPALVGGTGAPVIVVAWSLQYELLFYAFFALLILNSRLAVATAAIVAIWAALASVLGWPFPFSFLQPAYFALFGIGVWAGLAVRAGILRSIARPAVLVGALFFIAMLAMVGVSRAFPAAVARPSWLMECATFGLAAGLLIFGMATLETRHARFAPSWKPGLVLGDISYVLYLSHYPIIALFCKIGISLGVSGFAGATLWGGVTLIACLATASVLHVSVERPVLSSARSLLPHRRQAGPRFEAGRAQYDRR